MKVQAFKNGVPFDLEVEPLEGKAPSGKIVYATAETCKRWKALRQVAANEKVLLRPRAGFRIKEEQEYFWNRFQNKSPGWTPADRPGFSVHQQGESIDVSLLEEGSLDFLNRFANKFGFKRPYAKEPWHMDLDHEWKEH